MNGKRVQQLEGQELVRYSLLKGRIRAEATGQPPSPSLPFVEAVDKATTDDLQWAMKRLWGSSTYTYVARRKKMIADELVRRLRRGK